MLHRMIAASTLLALAACGSRAGEMGALRPDVSSCLSPSDTGRLRDTVTLSFTEPVDLAHAPVPRNDAERVYFGQLFESLVRLDCTGQLRPGLAIRWTGDTSGTVWTFELPGAAGPLPISAEAVVASWNSRRNGGIWPWPRILEARAVDARTVEVKLDTGFDQVPRAFALPPLAVETGSFRRDISAQPTAGPLLELIHLVPGRPGTQSPIIRFQVLRRGMDQRDLVDLPRVGLLRPADVMISRAPEVIEYVRSKPDFRAFPLPWDRTYLLVSTRALPQVGDTTDFRRSLSRDVVSAESRPVRGPFWREQLNCPGTTPLLPMGRRPEVVYPLDDASAREIAERVVAVEREPLRAVGLLPDPLSASLAGGEAALYVIPLPSIEPLGCDAIPQWPRGALVLPLVETRGYGLVRTGVPAFEVGRDGSIRFVAQPRPTPGRSGR